MVKINKANSEIHAALVGDLEDHQLTNNEEILRLRREYVNEAIELVGYNPVKIEQYLIKKHVA
jgi:MoxR-like ATPase